MNFSAFAPLHLSSLISFPSKDQKEVIYAYQNPQIISYVIFFFSRQGNLRILSCHFRLKTRVLPSFSDIIVVGFAIFPSHIQNSYLKDGNLWGTYKACYKKVSGFFIKFHWGPAKGLNFTHNELARCQGASLAPHVWEDRRTSLPARRYTKRFSTPGGLRRESYECSSNSFWRLWSERR